MYCTAFPTGFERDFYVCAINGTIARMMVDDTGAAAAGASNLHKVTPLLAQLNYIGCKAEQEDPVFTLHFELKLKTNNQKQHFKYFFWFQLVMIQEASYPSLSFTTTARDLYIAARLKCARSATPRASLGRNALSPAGTARRCVLMKTIALSLTRGSEKWLSGKLLV